MKRSLFVGSLVALTLGFGGCALFQSGPTDSTTVLTQVRQGETGLLVAETAVNIAEKGKVDPKITAAEQVIYDYLSAAEVAAVAGDTVTASQKLALFNQALADFNKQYLASQVTTQSSK